MNANRPTGLRDTVITLAGILILLGIARYASAIVVPFLLALFITIIAATPVNWLKNRGIPDLLSVGIVLLIVIVILLMLSLMLGSTMAQFNEALPEYQTKLSDLTKKITALLSERGVNIEEAGVLEAFDPGVVMTFANNLVIGLADVLSNVVLIMFMTMFMLVDVLDFPRKMKGVEGSSSEKMLEQVAQLVKSTNEYTAIKALMSLGTGVLIWLGLAIVGLDFALLWGVIAFLLNFIPNIGSILAAVPAVLLALVQLGPANALIVIAIYAAVNTIMGNVVETKIMGSRLGLSTLTVFLSLVFWGWLFGSVGMLLSVPLTMAVKFAAMNNPQTRWFGILLSPAPEDESSQPENGKADPGHSSSKHEELNSELAQLRLQLDELRKSRDAEENSTTPDNKK